MHSVQTYNFIELCKQCNIDLLKEYYLINSNKIDIHADNEEAFVNCCENGYQTMAQWIISLSLGEGQTPVNLDQCIDRAFRYSLSRDNLSLAKWLWSLIQEKDIDFQKLDFNSIFHHTCTNGLINSAKWVWRISPIPIDIHYLDDKTLRNSMLFGKAEVVDWLWRLSRTDGQTPFEFGSNSNITNMFKYNCTNGNISMAKWLLELGLNLPIYSIDLHPIIQSIFEQACINGHIDMAKWLWDISPISIDLHSNSEKIFIESCANGHLPISKWLIDTSLNQGQTKIDIGAQKDRAFRLSCKNEKLDVAIWLKSNNNHYQIEIGDKKSIYHEDIEETVQHLLLIPHVKTRPSTRLRLFK